MKGLLTAILALAVSHTIHAQSPEEQVKNRNEATLVAAQKRDIAAYVGLLSDDLRWIQADGSVLTKSQRIAQLEISSPATANTRTFSETDVRVYGNVAELICRSDYGPEGKRMAERVHRVFVNSNGTWMLVSHSATQIPRK